MLAKTIDIEDRIMQLEFIQSTALIGLCYFNFFAGRLKNELNQL